MDNLIERLEAATGPCRELDWMIAEYFGEIPEHIIQGPMGVPYGWFRREGQWSLTRTKESDVYAGVESWTPKPRTASIDAALTLATGAAVERCGGADGILRWALDKMRKAGATIADLPRFIVIAAFRARLATPVKSG